MQVQVTIDYQNKLLALAGRPTFNLVEIVSAKPNGSDVVGRNLKFEEDEFEELVRSNWDFNSIGFDHERPPVSGFGLIKAMTQAPRYPISLTQ